MIRSFLAVGFLCVTSAYAPAQSWQFWQPELRLDMIGPTPYSPQVGAGINSAAGYYVRWTAAAAWGKRQINGTSRNEWRGDLLARVTLDPFRQQRWGLSFGGGLSIRRRAYLAVIAEIEGPEMHGWLPALQVGASGGLRGGLVFRRAVPRRR